MQLRLLLGLCLCFFLSRAGAQQKIKYDGLYHTVSDSLNPFRFYLRFYNDNTVIGYTTAGKPEKLVSWFSKNHSSPSKGNYVISDSTIMFSLKSAEGIVEYKGTITSDNRLKLEVKSHINKYEGKEEYFFWPVSNLR